MCFVLQPPELHRKYICFYYNNHRNPRLLVNPAKVEIANLKPRVWMIRNVLTETEMNRLKELAGPKVGVSHTVIGSTYTYAHIQLCTHTHAHMHCTCVPEWITMAISKCTRVLINVR